MAYAPEPFADRVWNLHFLAEEPLRPPVDQVARVLIVETTSTDHDQSTRSFYEREGFDREARFREFYGPGDHRIVYWKSLVDTGS